MMEPRDRKLHKETSTPTTHSTPRIGCAARLAGVALVVGVGTAGGIFAGVIEAGYFFRDTLGGAPTGGAYGEAAGFVLFLPFIVGFYVIAGVTMGGVFGTLGGLAVAGAIALVTKLTSNVWIRSTLRALWVIAVGSVVLLLVVAPTWVEPTLLRLRIVSELPHHGRQEPEPTPNPDANPPAPVASEGGSHRNDAREVVRPFSTSTDGWQSYRSPLGGEVIEAISGSSAHDVWILARHGLARWDGYGWVVDTASPVDQAHDGSDLGVTLWVAAPDDRWLQLGGAFAEALWHWHRGEWTSYPGAGAIRIRGSSRDDVWAVGFEGSVRHWDGMAWSTMPERAHHTLTSVLALSRDMAIFVGEDATIGEWDGVAWRSQSGGPGAFRDVNGTTQDDIWAVGGHEPLRETGPQRRPRPVMPSDVPRGFHGSQSIQHWDGHAWTIHADAPAEDLSAVATDQGGFGWASGEHGHLWRWDGMHWRASDSGVDAVGAVWVAPDGEAWVAGPAGVLLRHAP